MKTERAFFLLSLSSLWILVQLRYRKTQNQTNRRFQSFSLKQSLKFLLIFKLPVSEFISFTQTDYPYVWCNWYVCTSSFTGTCITWSVLQILLGTPRNRQLCAHWVQMQIASLTEMTTKLPVVMETTSVFPPLAAQWDWNSLFSQ